MTYNSINIPGILKVVTDVTFCEVFPIMKNSVILQPISSKRYLLFFLRELLNSASFYCARTVIKVWSITSVLAQFFEHGLI